MSPRNGVNEPNCPASSAARGTVSVKACAHACLTSAENEKRTKRWTEQRESENNKRCLTAERRDDRCNVGPLRVERRVAERLQALESRNGDVSERERKLEREREKHTLKREARAVSSARHMALRRPHSRPLLLYRNDDCIMVAQISARVHNDNNSNNNINSNNNSNSSSSNSNNTGMHHLVAADERGRVCESGWRRLRAQQELSHSPEALAKSIQQQTKVRGKESEREERVRER
jgi:hypothetical protein